MRREYEKWYGNPHTAQALQAEAVYGLTEFYRDQIRPARLVAGTGCNAATGQFALRPLIAAGVIDLDDIIIDLKTGVSGAGRSLKENLLHAELSEGSNAYAVVAPIAISASSIRSFRPSPPARSGALYPASSAGQPGILATVYVSGDAQEIHDTFAAAYEGEPFVTLLPMGETPSTHHVRGSNFVHIGVTGDRLPGKTA